MKTVYQGYLKFYLSLCVLLLFSNHCVKPRAKEMTSLRSCVREQSVEKTLFYTVWILLISYRRNKFPSGIIFLSPEELSTFLLTTYSWWKNVVKPLFLWKTLCLPTFSRIFWPTKEFWIDFFVCCCFFSLWYFKISVY